MITMFETLDLLADPLHHPGAFMTQHHRLVCPAPAVAKVDIGMADARGHNAHQNFLGARALELERFDP